MFRFATVEEQPSAGMIDSATTALPRGARDRQAFFDARRCSRHPAPGRDAAAGDPRAAPPDVSA